MVDEIDADILIGPGSIISFYGCKNLSMVPVAHLTDCKTIRTTCNTVTKVIAAVHATTTTVISGLGTRMTRYYFLKVIGIK